MEDRPDATRLFRSICDARGTTEAMHGELAPVSSLAAIASFDLADAHRRLRRVRRMAAELVEKLDAEISRRS